MAGKGDKNRSLTKAYRDNYGDIDWTDEAEKERVQKLRKSIQDLADEIAKSYPPEDETHQA